jgi:transcriptional regulator with XRE-family HTH domain
MPRQNDHPLVRLRASRGYSVSAVAEAAGVTRGSIIAIEEGRTRTLKKSTAAELEFIFSLAPGQIQKEIDDWFALRPVRAQLTARQKALLALEPERLAKEFATFAHWRKQFGTVTSFSSLIGCNREVVAGYERKIRSGDMTVNLMFLLESSLNISHEYAVALSELEPS